VIPELIAIALATAIGFALAVRLDRDGPLLGESVLLGFGACAALLFVLSLLHIAWNRWWLIGLGVAAAVSLVLCGGARLVRRRARTPAATLHRHFTRRGLR